MFAFWPFTQACNSHLVLKFPYQCLNLLFFECHATLSRCVCVLPYTDNISACFSLLMFPCLIWNCFGMHSKIWVIAINVCTAASANLHILYYLYFSPKCITTMLLLSQVASQPMLSLVEDAFVLQKKKYTILPLESRLSIWSSNTRT